MQATDAWQTMALTILISAACHVSDRARPADPDAGEPDAGMLEVPGDPPPAPRNVYDVAKAPSDDVTRYLRARCQRMMACSPGMVGGEATCISGLAVAELECAPGLDTLELTNLVACVGRCVAKSMCN